LVILTLGNVFLAGAEINGITYRPDLTKRQVGKDVITVSEQFEELKKIIPANAIVMTPIKTSWPLPTFLPAKSVGMLHNNPYVLDYRQRINNVNAFFNPNTPEPERRDILKRYNVTHILVPKNDVYLVKDITTLSTSSGNQLRYWHVITIKHSIL
jgi:hypothetical protein